MTAIAGFCVMGMALPFSSYATERADIVSALNVLPLMINKITGDITMAVIYDPADAASKADAEGIMKIVDSSSDREIEIPGGGKLYALPVSIHEFNKLSRARIAFLTPGLTAHLDDISTVASAAGILTLSTDIDCVRAAKCIIGVANKSGVTIYFSKAAADNAKIEFTHTFSMLVKRP